MKLYFLIITTLLVHTCIAQIKEITKTIYFASNQYTLNEETKQILENLKYTISGRKIVDYSIEGSTDNIGNITSNELLSYQRAQTIEKWLQENTENGQTYFSKNKLIASGEKKPLNKNQTEEERSINRRALLKVSIDCTPLFTISNIKNNFLPKNMQSYCIHNNQDTVLICKKGTIIYIKAHSFNKVTDNQCLMIKVRESFTPFDALLNDLTTYNNKNILSSESMVEVQFEQNGKNIDLKPQNDYIIFSPTIANISDASLYYGVPTNNQINWEYTNNSLTQINANQLSLCNGQSFRNCVPLNNEYCHKRPFFLFGLGKLMTLPFKASGAEHWRNYRRCKKSHKVEKNPSVPINNTDYKYGDDMSKLQLKNIENRCYNMQAGPCGLLLNKMDLQCNINWQKKIQQSIDSIFINGDQLTIDNISSLQYIVFNRNNVGWSNIDWMLKVPESNRADIDVNLDDTKYTEAKIIFKNFKTILKATTDKNGKLYFPQMPINEPASIMILDTRTGTEKLLAEKLDIITKKQIIQPRFNTYTTSQYIKLLEGFK